MSRTDLRPRSAPEIADAAVQLVRRHFRPLVTLAALVSIPGIVLGIVQARFIPTPAMGSGIEAFPPALWLLLLASLLFFVLGLGAMIRATSAAYLDDQSLEPMAAIRSALARGPRLVLASLIAGVVSAVLLGLALGGISFLVGVGGVALVAAAGGGNVAASVFGLVALVAATVGMLLFGYLLLARYVNVPAVVMLEDFGVFGSVRRASVLAKGRLLAMATLLFLASLLYFLVYLSVWALASVLVGDPDTGGVLASLTTIPLFPFLSAVLTLLYYDLRIRREGLDLELLAQELDAAAEFPQPEGAR